MSRECRGTGDWSVTDLSVEDCFALVSRVEHGTAHALFAPPPPDPVTDILAAMVAEGDKLASISSRPSVAGVQRVGATSGRQPRPTMPTMARRLIDTYNDPRRLRTLVDQYAVPDERLRLLEFRQTPVVLHYLRMAFLEELYDAERLPLICLLNGERLSISVPEWLDLSPVFANLTRGSRIPGRTSSAMPRRTCSFAYP
jgi:hypothetical protein